MSFFRFVLLALCAAALAACGDADGPVESRTIVIDGEPVEGVVHSGESALLARSALVPMGEDGPMSLCEAWCAEACGGRSNVQWCHSGGGGCSTSCKAEGIGGLRDPGQVLGPNL